MKSEAPKSMHTRVHIVADGSNNNCAEFVTTLCGRSLPSKDYFMSWVMSEVGAHCAQCLRKWNAIAG
jgi:hypothetical protein